MPPPELACVAAEEICQLINSSHALNEDEEINLETVLASAGVGSDVFEGRNSLVDVESCWRIINSHQNLVHEESHLMSSRPLKPGTTRMVFNNLQHCETLADGLAALAETYNIIHGGDYNFVRQRGASISYRVDDREFHYQTDPQPFAIEFALIKIHCALSCLVGRPLSLKRVCTRRLELPSHHHHLSVFDAPVSVGSEFYELVYADGQSQLPFIEKGPLDISGNIYNQFLALKPNNDASFVQQVRQLIQRQLGAQIPNQELVAAELHISVATLRRRLQQEACSFRQLLDQAQAELAAEYLHQGVSPESVAQTLGYSELRSFKRAFKRWYQQSPADYRRLHKL